MLIGILLLLAMGETWGSLRPFKSLIGSPQSIVLNSWRSYSRFWGPSTVKNDSVRRRYWSGLEAEFPEASLSFQCNSR